MYVCMYKDIYIHIYIYIYMQCNCIYIYAYAYMHIYIYIYIYDIYISCWRSRDELIRDVLLWIPTHGRAKAGRPARTYIQQLCEDTGCCPEDLPRAMNDREEWRERVRDISVLPARYDDDDDDDDDDIYIYKRIYVCKNERRVRSV